jgi:hypothetical protein
MSSDHPDYLISFADIAYYYSARPMYAFSLRTTLSSAFRAQRIQPHTQLSAAE